MYSKVKFTESLYVNAIRVPTFEQVANNGELYYIECADHFAVKISGMLFHGNIGTIYTDEKNPEKIKDCKFTSSCKRTDCTYYHDPAIFRGSKDHRNFVAGSWLYVPTHSQYKNKSRSRQFGNRDNLDLEIVNLTNEEIKRFHDQTMHDILCSILIKQSFTDQ